MRYLIAVLLLIAGPALAEDRPYIFTQAHNATSPETAAVQQVIFGRTVQIQLPAGPATWAWQAASGQNVRLIGGTMVPSPGRIDGFDSVQVLEFEVTEMSAAKIVLQADTLPKGFEAIVPGGSYTLIVQPVPAL